MNYTQKNIHSTIEHRFSTVNIKQTKQKIYTISNIQQQHKASGTEKYTMQDENKTNKQNDDVYCCGSEGRLLLAN